MTFTRPLCTPSGLIMMKLCSEAIDGETKERQRTARKEGMEVRKKTHRENRNPRICMYVFACYVYVYLYVCTCGLVSCMHA